MNVFRCVMVIFKHLMKPIHTFDNFFYLKSHSRVKVKEISTQIITAFFFNNFIVPGKQIVTIYDIMKVMFERHYEWN